MVHLCIASLMMLLAMGLMAEEGKYPPGLDSPGQATCKNKQFKECYNSPHVCPKFCGDSGCHVNCVSCIPVCGPDDGSSSASPTPSPPIEPTPSPPVYPSPPTEPTPSPPSPTPNLTTPSNPPSSEVSCYIVEHVCPAACPTVCVVDCVTYKPIKRITLFLPLHLFYRRNNGITFYFHGKQNRDFCLLPDSNLHINAHFMLERDFTWVQSIGILFGDHQIYVGARKTASWNDAVDRLGLTFDGQPVYLPESEGAKWQSEIAPAVTITRSSVTNKVIVEVEGNFKISATVVPITEEESKVHNYGITKDVCFAHLDLGFKFYSLGENVNGVLGQTYANNYVTKVNMSASMAVMGGEDKFITSGVFAKDCAVARFTGSSSSESSSEYTIVSSSSGIDGRGVVCKK
ncbi:hypothetical protein MKX01_014684 [Papaver californicum]|nr:hypothetical protein MKX01_014684 [Papaver californicum]